MSTQNNTAPVMNEDLDTELLERRFKAMYQAVAADPHGDFHFEMGREMAERLVYPTFERNQRRIESNRRSESTGGAPREETSLLQGLVLCARCGRPMKVNDIRFRHPRSV